MRKERVGFALCGSFCTHEKVLRSLEELAKQYETVIPIVRRTRHLPIRGLVHLRTAAAAREITGHEVLCDRLL